VFEKNGGGGKDYRTALICISAGGQVLSPFILYAGKHLMDTWCKGGPDGTHYGVTKKVSCNEVFNRMKIIVRMLGLDRCTNV
jgi:hypothetical protein